MATNEELIDDTEYWYGELLDDFYSLKPDKERTRKNLEGFVHTVNELIDQMQ